MENRFLISKFINFISLFLRVFKFPISINRSFNSIKHTFIESKIKKYCIEACNAINNIDYIGVPSHKNIIWVFWWQGCNSMPLLVNKCIKSIFKYSNNYIPIFISKYNVKKYTNIPNFIYHKLYSGSITLTEFSDILRYDLLYNYGGLWIDSTILCSSKLDANHLIDHGMIVTNGCFDKYHYWVCNKWTESLIGGFEGNHLFKFMIYFFINYWKYNNYLISYNLVDYALYFAYINNIGNFKYFVDNDSSNNNRMFDLIKYLNKPFNKEYLKYVTSNTHLFKLTYKMLFNDSDNTLYHKIISGEFI